MKEDDNAIITGTRNIVDLNEVTFAHFMQITPSVMKKKVVTAQVSVYTYYIYHVSFPMGFAHITRIHHAAQVSGE